MHKHTEPGWAFQHIAWTIFFMCSAIIIEIMTIVIVSYYKNGGVSKYADMLIMYSILSGFIIIIVVTISLLVIRNNKTYFLSDFQKGCFLKVYPDGCIRPGRIFWMSGDEVYRIYDKESDFDSHEIYIHEIVFVVEKNFGSVHVQVSAKIEVKRNGFDPFIYKQKIAGKGFSSFEDFFKKAFVRELKRECMVVLNNQYMEGIPQETKTLSVLAETFRTQVKNILRDDFFPGMQNVSIVFENLVCKAQCEEEIST